MMSDATTAAPQSDGPIAGREKWGWRLDFLFTNIGYVACFQSLWRFPILCYYYGGVMFFVPYLIFSMFLGIPLMYMEMAIGQYTSSGSIKAWRKYPGFQGVGIASTIVLWWHNIYYNVVLAWIMYYLYSSFTGGSELPWARCNNEWNSPDCLDYGMEWACINGSYHAVPIGSNFPDYNSWASHTIDQSESSQQGCGYPPITTRASQDFWQNKVLERSNSIQSPGSVVGHLAFTLFLSWILVYFFTWKVQWTGKVAYFTAPFIHIMIIVFFIRGATLPGAVEGMKYYLYPQRYALQNFRAWMTAGTEAIINFSVGIGAHTTLGSYNQFNGNFYRDSMIVAFLNLMGNIYISGIMVFSFIGFLAYNEGLPIQAVVTGGTDLFFQVFPHAMSGIPMARVWTALFFIVVFCIALNTQLVNVQAFATSILDIFPTSLQIRFHKEIFVLLVCFVNFLIGLSMVTQGGWYVFRWFDLYVYSGVAILFICFFESIAIGWFYGIRKFASNIAEMSQRKQIEWYFVCLPFTVPLISFILWIGSVVEFFQFGLPTWKHGLGLLLVVASIVWIPVGIVYHVAKPDGPIFRTRNVWMQSSTPLTQHAQGDNSLGTLGGTELGPISTEHQNEGTNGGATTDGNTNPENTPV